MAGYTLPYNTTQPYQATQYFPQPQGNVYMVNNSLEVANIPMGSGISAVICMNENAIYLKTMQNGMPSVMAYTLSPFSSAQAQTSPTPSQTSNSDLEARLSAIEETLTQLKSTKGGITNELL